MQNMLVAVVYVTEQFSLFMKYVHNRLESLGQRILRQLVFH